MAKPNNKTKYLIYWLAALVFVCALAYYPIRMGVKVISLQAANGSVSEALYPKYVIPYAPLSLAALVGTLIMPLMQKLFKKRGFWAGLLIAAAVFFIAEQLMETKILVETREMKTQLESWQMALCYVPPEFYETRVWQAVDVLLGGYSPWFKLHFYFISVVILVSLLNGVYGFGRIIKTGDRSRLASLIMQTAAGLMFLGMCVWACFTAFYRTGELTVPPVSAVLMAVFFIVMGVTVGLFVGSFTINKSRALGLWLPACAAALTTLLMYAGEMILLNGELYRFGRGFLFSALPVISLAPVDIMIILASGAAAFGLCGLARHSSVK